MQQCPICTADMFPETVCRLNCGHTFHSACVQYWKSINDSCPVCREPVQCQHAHGHSSAILNGIIAKQKICMNDQNTKIDLLEDVVSLWEQQHEDDTKQIAVLQLILILI